MPRIIFCTFLEKKSEGQDYQSYPGELGKKIYNQISKTAWKQWIIKQTILINEKKLNMCNINDQEEIEKQMKLFLFKKTEKI
ncbi:MAG: oxidative damage protection protein [Buchnera aphidicola (Brevicoryne brassicae)]|uniref:Probable Fe(2+)-trafficking protein n=1 Tax=Buchnera aphidicola (Brevicoryne brassicae) TaxID=911343 RepID=A0AAJ5TX93_9GAMM|nr:oxidative damage protection protein [Buchnera aphidicola]QCI20094.1 oxidative damage protection protein [Buchnera aphidicola (Brevicoryne brassicae)]WAI18918.1 MAG: oxidative damage protection protein [Buchnera aphidicola (Brevicoryne brassicae)]